jgi:hypothetical protein
MNIIIIYLKSSILLKIKISPNKTMENKMWGNGKWEMENGKWEMGNGKCLTIIVIGYSIPFHFFIICPFF